MNKPNIPDQDDLDKTPVVHQEGEIGQTPFTNPGYSHPVHPKEVVVKMPQDHETLPTEHNPFIGNGNDYPQKEIELKDFKQPPPPPAQNNDNQAAGEVDPKGKKKDANVAYETEDHLLSLESLAAKYQTNININQIDNSAGLTTEQANELLAKNGKNMLTPPKERSEFVKFFSHLGNFLNILLIVAGGLSFLGYGLDTTQSMNLYLGIFLECLVLFDLIIEYMQERSTSDVMGQFKKMLPPVCTVIRNGKEDQTKAENLVVGDIVKIEGGKRIPADIRVIQSRGLKVEQSALNGESEEIEIFAESLGHDIMDSKNLIFNGCQAIEGSAVGVVINTGDNTYLGLVAKQTTQTKGEETQFQKEIKTFVKFVFVLGSIMGLIVFVIGVARNIRSDLPAETNRSFAMSMFINGFIVLLIANVPEGLPATVTTCLTIIAKKLAKKKVFIKKLECVEALGSATVIASDKTGTLTMNKMTLEHVWFDGHIYTGNYVKENRRDFKGNKSWKILFKVACLCNRAFFKEPDEEKEKRMKEEEKNADEKEKLIQKEVDEPDRYDGMIRKSFKPAQSSNKMAEEMKKYRQSSRNLIAEYKKSSSSFRQEVEIIGENSKGMPNSQIILAQIKENDIEEEKKMMHERNKRKKWQVIGDASETALIRFCEEFKNTDSYKAKYEKIFEVPFNSKNKFQISIHEIYEKRFLVMKGGPDILIKRCSHYLKHGEPRPIDEKFMAQFQKTYEVLGTKGERVLGAAYYDLGNEKKTYSISGKNYKDSGLVFVGLFALMDPPKPGVEEAITSARQAHVRVMMVTGDHPLTAEAIARKVGIIRHYQTDKEVAAKKKIDVKDVDPQEALAKVIYGPDLLKYTESMWDDLILGKKEIVFSRISPQQKVEIVKNLQRLNEIVIVTGDGVNDAIALKKANIGVAMGEGGSDVAREAADVIFIDDNFASIVHAIEEGRRLFDNLKKSIVYTVTHGNVEVLPVLLNIAIDMPLGMTSLQILAMDLGTELGPAISMSYEYAEDDIMNRPPRNVRTEKLVSGRTLAYAYLQASWIEICFCLLAYFSAFWDAGISGDELSGIANDNFNESPSGPWISRNGDVFSTDRQVQILHTAQCAYFVTLVMSQFCHIWFCRTRQKSIFSHGFRNVVCNYGVLLEITILMIIVFIPAMQPVFNTVTLDGIYWTQWIGSLICFFVFHETRKWWTRKYPNGKVAKYLLW